MIQLLIILLLLQQGNMKRREKQVKKLLIIKMYMVGSLKEMENRIHLKIYTMDLWTQTKKVL
ncbi:hypothetical protein COL93_24470 [Bacillus toyonensis]|uniref:Uncharacterized protein n=1 Tax=Bacillus toyonensis TaxID=155322 RepID=A0A2C4QUR6_9BACI|nr:hypothetical protein COL93_24470 [Bacillus toyonensis]PHD68230.1 hypothetical protein COF40_18240 [Bacillus toyonensis]